MVLTGPGEFKRVTRDLGAGGHRRRVEMENVEAALARCAAERARAVVAQPVVVEVMRLAVRKDDLEPLVLQERVRNGGGHHVHMVSQYLAGGLRGSAKNIPRLSKAEQPD